MSKVEILAPAGSIEGLYASMEMGADAVYVGTNRFGARAYADNPTREQLEEALVYAHLRNKKIYLTVNTLLNDEELEKQLFPMIEPLYESGLDACIVQDFGVLSFLHDIFPDMDLHASTQMTLFDGDEAEQYRNCGVTRYVPARELTIEEIRKAREKTKLEIEVFVHGALCYCYSGQCLMSEQIGGRSGNRGMCAQPCRLPFSTPYGDKHWFSTKDSCTLLHVPDLVDAGIDSFKIEGRMKKKQYAAYLSYLYRHYVDVYEEEGRDYYKRLVEDKDSSLWKDYKRCLDLYNRGGFSQSFLFEKDKKKIMFPEKNGHYGICVGKVIEKNKRKAKVQLQEAISYQDILEFRDKKGNSSYEYTVKDGAAKGMIIEPNVLPGSNIYVGQSVYRIRNKQLMADIEGQLERRTNSIGLSVTLQGKMGEPVLLTITGNGVTVCQKGVNVEKAQKCPVTKEDVEKRLRRMGETRYEWDSVTVEWDEDVFVPLGEINRLRREGIATWEKKAVFQRKPASYLLPCTKEIKREGKKIPIISISNISQLKLALLTKKEKARIHVKLEDFSVKNAKELYQVLQNENREIYLSFPQILRGDKLRRWKQDWLVQRQEWQKINIAGIVINSHRALLIAEKNFPNAEKLADENWYCTNERAKQFWQTRGVDTSLSQVYGRIPVMVSEGCLKKTTGNCDGKEERIEVNTPKRDKFVVVNHCDCCYNTIYTKEAVKTGETEQIARLNFSWETVEEMRKVLREWNLL